MPSIPAVRRRRVYYLCGFDPRGAAFYHPLYQAEASKQQGVDDCHYVVSASRSDAPHVVSWDVEMRQGEHTTYTQYNYLVWDDMVHVHWSKSVLGVLKRTLQFSTGYARSDALRAMWAVSRRFFWTLLTPLLSLLLSLLAASAGGLLVAWGIYATGAPLLWAGLGGVACVAGILWGCWRYARTLRLPWLISGFAFLLHWGDKGDASLDQRFAELAQHIHNELSSDDADEVLVVAHCAGTIAAICLLESLQRVGQQLGVNAPIRRVKLLTLAQVIPMLGLMKTADWFRDRLTMVAQADMPWLDYSSPADPLCCALADPLASCGISCPTRTAGYRVRSARFDKMFEAAEYAQVRRDPFRVHFQYLMSTCLLVDNNFFKLTAGPHALETHIAAKANAN